MSGQAGDQGSQPAPDAGAVPQAKAPGPTPDLSALEKKVAELERDNHAYREKQRLAREAEEAAALRRGEVEPLLAEREKELAEARAKLLEYEPVVERERKRLAEREAAVAEKVKALSADDQAIVAAVADVDAKERLLARLTVNEKPAERKKATSPTPRTVNVEPPTSKGEQGPPKPFRIF